HCRFWQVSRRSRYSASSDWATSAYTAAQSRMFLTGTNSTHSNAGGLPVADVAKLAEYLNSVPDAVEECIRERRALRVPDRDLLWYMSVDMEAFLFEPARPTKFSSLAEDSPAAGRRSPP